MTRATKPSSKMVTPNLAPPPLENSAQPKAGRALLTTSTSFADRFRKDKRGSTAIIFSLMITPIMLMTGMAVDYSRMITVKQRMQTAVDAAALAGVRAAQLNSSSSGSLEIVAKAAQNYYDAMALGKLPYAVVDAQGKLAQLDVKEDPATNTFTVTAKTWVQTPFMSVVNSGTNPGATGVCASNKSNCQEIVTSASVIATVGCFEATDANCYSIETSFMLDITGSMDGQPLTDLKNAANAAIDILVPKDPTKQTSRVAIVPFAEDVRLPTATAFTAATGLAPVRQTKLAYGRAYPNGKRFAVNGTSWCGAERQGIDRYLDTAPSPGNRPVADWKYSPTDGFPIDCNVPRAAAIQPLTSDRERLHTLVNGLQIAGGTAGHVGISWAWYMLSPNFKNLWDSANQPKDYDTAFNINTGQGNASQQKLRKYAVLMTDGDFNVQYSADGIVTTVLFQPNANDTSTNQAAAICNNMKARGIEVFTIAFNFDDGLSTQAQTLLEKCATQIPGVANDTSHYYLATNGDGLTKAFKDIALKISQIRVAG